MKTAHKTAVAFALLLMVMATTIVLSIVEIKQLEKAIATIDAVNNRRADLSATMILSIEETAVAIRDAALASSDEDVQVQARKIKGLFSEYDKARDLLRRSFEQFPVSDEEKMQFVRAVGAEKSARGLMNQLLDPGQNFEPDDIKMLIAGSLSNSQNAWISELSKLSNGQREQSAKSVSEIQAVALRSIRVISICGISCLVICVASGMVLARSITTGISSAVAISERVSTGDLMAHPKSNRSDEFGALVNSMAEMSRSLNGVVTKVRGTTDEVTSHSGEVASASHDLSVRTEQTASDIQGTLSAVEELDGSVRQSEESARKAHELSQKASAKAQAGGRAVEAVVTTMNSIQTSSHRIKEIITTIDGIAFQTNILALNAAVESARAGEQGRGFAVVANEVRALAQRSAAAAKEISGLISDSVARIEEGAQRVGSAKRTMTEVSDEVEKVNSTIFEITTVSSHQTRSISEIRQAINDIDASTQQNAALVEELAASATVLRSQSENLTEAVSVFRC